MCTDLSVCSELRTKFRANISKVKIVSNTIIKSVPRASVPKLEVQIAFARSIQDKIAAFFFPLPEEPFLRRKKKKHFFPYYTGSNLEKLFIPYLQGHGGILKIT